MARNDIRLRRQRMSAGNIARHRNYGELMDRHAREQKLKRIFRLVVYFLAAAFLIVLFVIVMRWEKRTAKKVMSTTPQSEASVVVPSQKPCALTL